MYKYVDKKGQAAMLAVKRSADATPEVNLKSVLHIGEGVCKGFILASKPKADVTRSPKEMFGYPLFSKNPPRHFSPVNRRKRINLNANKTFYLL